MERVCLEVEDQKESLESVRLNNQRFKKTIQDFKFFVSQSSPPLSQQAHAPYTNDHTCLCSCG